MLKQIFQTVPIKYGKTGEVGEGNPFGVSYSNAIPPYAETLSTVTGLFVHATPTINGPNCIYMLTMLATNYWPSWAIAFHRFDSVTGAYVQRVPLASNVGGALLGGALRSRLGKLYWKHAWHTSLIEFSITFDENDKPTGIANAGSTIESDHFDLGLIGFGQVVIDDFSDTMINGTLRKLDVYRLGSGEHRYSINLPDNIAAIALEDSEHVYVLCANRILLLIDYTRAEILGAVRVPASPSGHEYWNNADVNMTWDTLYRRLLVCEKVANNPNGSSATKVKGFRAVPMMTRLTTPIPLRVPRKGRTIPVLCSVVGDMNEGVGGNIVTSVVTGDGSLVGVPITDNRGHSKTRVACGVPSTIVDPGGYGGGSPDDTETYEELAYTTVNAAGVFPDVSYYDDDQYIAYERAGHLRVLKNGDEIQAYPLTGTLCFCKLVGKSLIFRGNGATYPTVFWPDVNLGVSTFETLDPQATGNDPVAISATALAWQTGGSYQIKRKNRQTGAVQTLGFGRPTGLSRITDSAVVLVDDDRLRAEPGGTVWGTRPVFAGSLVVCEGANGGAMVRVGDDPATQLVLWPGDECFTPRIAINKGDVTVVTWGTNGVRKAEFPVSALTNYVPSGTGPDDGTQSIAPVIGRDIGFGYFFQFSKQYGDNPSAPSNWAFINDAEKVAVAAGQGKKLIVGGPAVLGSVGFEDDVYGIYVSGGASGSLHSEAAKQLAILPPSLIGKPIVGCFDGGQTMPTGSVTDVDILAIECYVGEDETADDCFERVLACMDNLPLDQLVILIGDSYTSNDNNTRDAQVLMDAQTIPADVAVLDDRVVGILMFSDGRPTGTRDHEMWRPIHQAIFDGIGVGGSGTPVGNVKLGPGMVRVVCTVTKPTEPEVPASGTEPGATGPGGGPGGTGILVPTEQRVSLQIAGTDFRYVGVTAFGLFKKYLDGDDISTFMSWALGHDFTVLRVLGMVGGPSWVDNGFAYYPGDGASSANTAEYYSKLTDFANFVTGTGLAIEFVCLADVQYIASMSTQPARVAHCTAVANALEGIAKVFIEICNEPPFNGMTNTSDLVACAAAVKAADGTRHIALGSESGGDWDALTYASSGTDYLTFHGDRGSANWDWLAHYAGSAVLGLTTHFPVEDEPQKPEGDPEPGKFFALGALSQLLQFGVTFHFGEGLIADVPTGASLDCAEEFAAGVAVADWDFGGALFVDFDNSPLASGTTNPVQIVGRRTATEMQLIALGCPSGWSPMWSAGWSGLVESTHGTDDCAQWLTGIPPAGEGPGEGGEPEGVATAPNRLAILQTVLDSREWKLNLGDEYDRVASDGRGAFTEAAVTALHADNANWGHIRKNPGQNQYNGHAVDAIIWKRPDASAAEIYDIVSGAGDIGWGFVSAALDDLDLWKYPA